VHFHFTYHSQTQRIVHGMPFLLLIGTSAWLNYSTHGTSELAGIAGLLAFGWLLLANFSMNALVRHWGPRFGPIDLTKNISPTSTERLLRGLILVAAAAVGVVTGIIVVQGIVLGWEVKILVAGLVFVTVAGVTYGTLTFAVIVLSGFQIRPTRG
jgi:hypothetical protein